MKEILLSLLILALASLPACSSQRPESKPQNNQTQNEQSAQNETLTDEEAQRYALTHAQLNEEDVTGLRTEYDRDDNVYEVEFSHNGWEHEYKIHAVSGAVLSSAQKRQG